MPIAPLGIQQAGPACDRQAHRHIAGEPLAIQIAADIADAMDSLRRVALPAAPAQVLGGQIGGMQRAAGRLAIGVGLAVELLQQGGNLGGARGIGIGQDGRTSLAGGIQAQPVADEGRQADGANGRRGWMPQDVVDAAFHEVLQGEGIRRRAAGLIGVEVVAAAADGAGDQARRVVKEERPDG